MTADHDDADQLADRYESEAPEPPPGLTIPDVFAYIHFKAFAFLAVGPDEYRKRDALHFPPESLPLTVLNAVIRGCEQILYFRGLSPDRPLEAIGVGGFYELMRLFHFDAEKQSTIRTGGVSGLLDEMHVSHLVDGRELTLYNRVTAESVWEHVNDTPLCPYCQGLLRTPFAKQCRHCGMDWHDQAR